MRSRSVRGWLLAGLVALWGCGEEDPAATATPPGGASGAGGTSSAGGAGAAGSAGGGLGGQQGDAGAPQGGAGQGGEPSCVPGEQDCACKEGALCGANVKQEALECRSGLCQPFPCTPGETGCVCASGKDCTSTKDTCEDGFCRAPECQPGAENCACLTDGSCNSGLHCLGGQTCVNGAGYEGGSCLDDGTCHTGATCDTFQQICVHCETGTKDCTCSSSGACSAGLACAGGLCISASSMPPKNPTCYTPCLQDLIVGEQVRACDSDGLLAGCIDDQVCVDGSCVPPGGTKPSCTTDGECPSFQTCLQGGCYSNCEQSADCASGLGCYHKVCRVPCATAASTCPAGSACKADDGENGFCVPVSPSSPEPGSPPTGGFEVGGSMSLSNVQTSGALRVQSRGDFAQEITVRKVWHQVHYADGKVERVDAPRDPQTAAFLACDPVKNECPLWWLDVGSSGALKKDPSVSFIVPANCKDSSCPNLEIANGSGVKAVRWEGQLEVSSKNGTATVRIDYVERPEGQWNGSAYYFGTFSDQGLEDWVKSPNKQVASGVENALIQRWAALRSGNIAGGWHEFQAVLTATREGSWRFGNVQKQCAALNSGSTTAVCYPYNNAAGVSTYVQNVNAVPVPSGVSELPMAMNLQISPDNPRIFQGRVETSAAMHYPGNPGLALEFAKDPSSTGSCLSGGQDCLVPLADINGITNGSNLLKSDLGGRYIPSGASPTCASGYSILSFPWYVDGFSDGTFTDGKGGRRRAECRDNQLPFNPISTKDALLFNTNLAGGNPVPDGLPRKRAIQFIDGALVNQNQIFLLFREQYDSFIPGQKPISAYGYMLLKRQAADLGADAFTALPTANSTPKTDKRASLSCDPALFQGYGSLDAGQKVDLMLHGSGASSANFKALPAQTGAYAGISDGIHYLCEDTGMFDGGPLDKGALPVKKACPVGSKVTFFDVGRGQDRLTQEQIANQECQTKKQADGRSSCQETLNDWLSAGTGYVLEAKPVYVCADPEEAHCDPLNRLDMRQGKVFYERVTQNNASTLLPLRTLIDSAFRYKTRFKSTLDEGSVGFSPQLCVKGSDKIPYCYDPDEISEARKRIDCLLAIANNDAAQLNNSPKQRDELREFLKQNFSQIEPGFDGFERLYAELLVMLGDDAYTAALGSRFDLAGMINASFLGSEFETDGIDISGGAGAEMFLLYRATQYYQLALDRLYLMGANFQTTLATPVGSPQNFVTSETVSMYLERLVGAAAQKGRTWGEVARRYQALNRPDLARRVTERAYLSTYMESALIERLMLDIEAAAGNKDRAQIHLTIENAQRRYRMALLEMRDVYASITDNVNFFGYSADYIPFPQVDNLVGQSQTGFEVLLAQARTKMELAKQREQTAQAEYRAGKVALAEFQSQLVNIRNNYENQLASLCGTFTGPDGQAYPAIRKYAQIDSTTSQIGDPCGRLGNGQIFQKIIEAQTAALGVKSVALRHDNILKKIDLIRATAAKQCKLNQKLADIEFKSAKKTISIEKQIDLSRALVTRITGVISATVESMKIADCEGLNCVSSGVLSVAAATALDINANLQFASELDIANKQEEIKDIQAETAKIVKEGQCDAVAIDAERDIVLAHHDLLETELELLRADYQNHLALSEIQRATSEAQRLQAQEAEANELTINVEAARSDPNVRVFKQDAVENADISFRDALTAAYRATRVLEYYTSQTYKKRDQLFLIRMVTAGQYNLENYINELDNAFHDFEETFGVPDTRVMVISLKDDILRIPVLGEDNLPLSEDARTKLMRDQLKDVSLLDSNGYLTLPFSTEASKLSPLTRNHKIKYIEADIQGNKLGDYVARLYLQSAGTGVIRTLADDNAFYVMPKRTAVINPSLQGAKTYEADVYRSTRHHDRPLVNTLWNLIINQRDEEVNKDIDLQSVTDVRLLVYYTDFTSFN